MQPVLRTPPQDKGAQARAVGATAAGPADRRQDGRLATACLGVDHKSGRDAEFRAKVGKRTVHCYQRTAAS